MESAPKDQGASKGLTEPQENAESSAPSARAVLVLLSVGFNNMMNLFVALNFLSTVNIAGKVFSVPPSHIPWWLSAQMAAQILTMLPAAGLWLRYPVTLQFILVLDTLVGAILCWVAVIAKSFGLLMVAGVVLGLGAGMSSTTPVLMSTWWLEDAWVTFGTNCLMVAFLSSANLSNLILPLVISNDTGMINVTLVEIGLAVLSLAMFFLFYRSPSDEKLEAAASPEGDGQEGFSIMDLISDSQFWVRLIGCSLMAGPATTLAGLFDLIGTSFLHLTNQQCQWITIAFLVSAGVMSLLLGAYDMPPSWMRGIFPVASVTCTIFAIIVLAWSSHSEPLPGGLYALVVILGAVLGGTTWGLLGIMLVSWTDFPFPIAITTAVMQAIIVGLGALIPVICGNKYGLTIIAAMQWAATLLWAFFYKNPERMSRMLSRRLEKEASAKLGADQPGG